MCCFFVSFNCLKQWGSERTRTNMEMEVPLDLIMEILVVKSLCRFRCVSELCFFFQIVTYNSFAICLLENHVFFKANFPKPIHVTPWELFRAFNINSRCNGCFFHAIYRLSYLVEKIWVFVFRNFPAWIIRQRMEDLSGKCRLADILIGYLGI